MMNTGFFTTARIAGILLLLYPLLLLAAVALLVAQGRLTGMAAAFSGVTAISGDASGLRTIVRFVIPATMALLAGFALFILLQYQAGDGGLAVVGMTLLLFSAVFSAIEGTFHASVTVWAAREAARTGAAPAFYEPLRRWFNGDVQIVYMSFFLVAMLLFSGSALRTDLLPSWAAWAALGLSLLAFPLYFLVLGAPAIIVLFPLLFGIGLLLSG